MAASDATVKMLIAPGWQRMPYRRVSAGDRRLHAADGGLFKARQREVELKAKGRAILIPWCESD